MLQLAASTMWTSDSSHTCPSPGTNAMLMTAQTVVRLIAMATACCLKDIPLWCGGVCEGRQSEQMCLHERSVAFHLERRLFDTPVAACNNRQVRCQCVQTRTTILQTTRQAVNTPTTPAKMVQKRHRYSWSKWLKWSLGKASPGRKLRI